jgi:peptidoglycan/LPS O-acetylase OafA/YrhL
VKSSTLFWAFLVVAAYFARPFAPYFFILSAVFATTAISRHMSGAPVKIRLPDFWLEQLRRAGVWSYSIYLLHQPLLEMFCGSLSRHFPATPSLLKLLCCLMFCPVIVVIAGIWFRLFERPGIGLGKRLIQKLNETRAFGRNCATAPEIERAGESR